MNSLLKTGDVIEVKLDRLIKFTGSDWFIGMHFMKGEYEFKIFGTNCKTVTLEVTKVF